MTAPPTPVPREGHITCMSECGYSGHLIYPTLWVWPVMGILLALVLFAWRLRRKKKTP